MRDETQKKIDKLISTIDFNIIEPESGRVISREEMMKDIQDFIEGINKKDKNHERKESQ